MPNKPSLPNIPNWSGNPGGLATQSRSSEPLRWLQIAKPAIGPPAQLGALGKHGLFDLVCLSVLCRKASPKGGIQVLNQRN